jgi:alkylhydroperoxidase family enzyme
MVATIVSGATGCRYCQAHTAHGAVRMAGAGEARTSAVWEFETNELFTPAERAALSLAAATDEHFRELERHFSTRAIMEVMGMICVIAFLNRWNNTVATEPEDAPFNFARQIYDAAIWSAGKHRQE